MFASVPASSANLGPGFDVLAIALDLRIEVEVRPAARLSLESEGEGAELPVNAEHLAVRVITGVLGHDRFAARVRSAIPLSRGLGSSAALTAAAAAAAGATDPLAVAASVDGHAENAAASVLGGLVAAAMVDGRPIARRLPLDEELSYVLLVPDKVLATKDARSVLPEVVSFADAVSNLGRLGLLIAGLGQASALDPAAGLDRLHQDARAALFPEAPELLVRLGRAGAVVACWSGAGSSLLGICRGPAVAAAVRDAGEEALERLGVPGRALCLAADRRGLIRSERPPTHG